jgi:cobalt-zinc-cadmium efflux system membrane fusion protein
MKKILTTMTLSSILLLAACDQSDKGSDAAKTPQDQTSQNHSLVKPSAELLARLNFTRVEEVDWRTQLKVSGSIELDEKRVARVGTTVSGRVTEIKVLRGDQVKKGDVLAMVHSPVLAEAQLAYLQAQSQYDLSRKAAARAQLLFKEGVIAAAEQQRRESELVSSEAEWQAARDRMHILGMTNADIKQLERSRKIQSVTALRAPIDGVVIDRKVSQGQVLEPADLAYTIADLSQIWVVGEVPERYSSEMYREKAVTVTIPALAGEERKTQLSYVADTVTPQTRTLRVRAVLDNSDGRLKPDMLATLIIEGKAKKRLAIPETAIVREENSDKVFVQVAQGQFELISVKLGEEENGLRPVESGLKQGQEIVSDGVFYLNADRLLKLQGE